MNSVAPDQMQYSVASDLGLHSLLRPIPILWVIMVFHDNSRLIFSNSTLLMSTPGFKFNFFDSLLKLASGIIFYLLNLSANFLFHIYKHC